MSLVFEDRPSDSPFVELIWRSRCERPGPFRSLALNRWQLVVWNEQGKTYFSIRGPETHVTPAYCPAHDGFVGIVLTPGTFMPHLPTGKLVDTALHLPGTSSKTFWLHGSVWQFPDYENADVFVERLAREGLLVREPLVEAALAGHIRDVS